MSNSPTSIPNREFFSVTESGLEIVSQKPKGKLVDVALKVLNPNTQVSSGNKIISLDPTQIQQIKTKIDTAFSGSNPVAFFRRVWLSITHYKELGCGFLDVTKCTKKLSDKLQASFYQRLRDTLPFPAELRHDPKLLEERLSLYSALQTAISHPSDEKKLLDSHKTFLEKIQGLKELSLNIQKQLIEANACISIAEQARAQFQSQHDTFDTPFDASSLNTQIQSLQSLTNTLNQENAPYTQADLNNCNTLIQSLLSSVDTTKKTIVESIQKAFQEKKTTLERLPAVANPNFIEEKNRLLQAIPETITYDAITDPENTLQTTFQQCQQFINTWTSYDAFNQQVTKIAQKTDPFSSVVQEFMSLCLESASDEKTSALRTALQGWVSKQFSQFTDFQKHPLVTKLHEIINDLTSTNKKDIETQLTRGYELIKYAQEQLTGYIDKEKSLLKKIEDVANKEKISLNIDLRTTRTTCIEQLSQAIFQAFEKNQSTVDGVAIESTSAETLKSFLDSLLAKYKESEDTIQKYQAVQEEKTDAVLEILKHEVEKLCQDLKNTSIDNLDAIEGKLQSLKQKQKEYVEHLTKKYDRYNTPLQGKMEELVLRASKSKDQALINQIQEKQNLVATAITFAAKRAALEEAINAIHRYLQDHLNLMMLPEKYTKATIEGLCSEDEMNIVERQLELALTKSPPENPSVLTNLALVLANVRPKSPVLAQFKTPFSQFSHEGAELPSSEQQLLATLSSVPGQLEPSWIAERAAVDIQKTILSKLDSYDQLHLLLTNFDRFYQGIAPQNDFSKAIWRDIAQRLRTKLQSTPISVPNWTFHTQRNYLDFIEQSENYIPSKLSYDTITSLRLTNQTIKTTLQTKIQEETHAELQKISAQDLLNISDVPPQAITIRPSNLTSIQETCASVADSFHTCKTFSEARATCRPKILTATTNLFTMMGYHAPCTEQDMDKLCEYVQDHEKLPPTLKHVFDCPQNFEALRVLAELIYDHSALMQDKQFPDIATKKDFGPLFPENEYAQRCFSLLHALKNSPLEGCVPTREQAGWAININKLLINNPEDPPQAIYGKSGSGKTVIIKLFLDVLPTWQGEKTTASTYKNPHIVIASPFAETSPESGDVAHVMLPAVAGNVTLQIPDRLDPENTVLIVDEAHILETNPPFNPSLQNTLGPPHELKQKFLKITATPITSTKFKPHERTEAVLHTLEGKKNALQTQAQEIETKIEEQTEQLKSAFKKQISDHFQELLKYCTQKLKVQVTNQTYDQYLKNIAILDSSPDSLPWGQARHSFLSSLITVFPDTQLRQQAEHLSRIYFGTKSQVYKNDFEIEFEKQTKTLAKPVVVLSAPPASPLPMAQPQPATKPSIPPLPLSRTHLIPPTQSSRKIQQNTVSPRNITTPVSLTIRPLPEMTALAEIQEKKQLLTNMLDTLDNKIKELNTLQKEQEAAYTNNQTTFKTTKKLREDCLKSEFIEVVPPTDAENSWDSIATTVAMNLQPNVYRAQIVLPFKRMDKEKRDDLLLALQKQFSRKPVHLVFRDSDADSTLKGQDCVAHFTDQVEPLQTPEKSPWTPTEEDIVIMLYDSTNQQGGDFGQLSTNTAQHPIQEWVFLNEPKPISETDLYQAVMRRRGLENPPPRTVVSSFNKPQLLQQAAKKQSDKEKQWTVSEATSKVAALIQKLPQIETSPQASREVSGPSAQQPAIAHQTEEVALQIFKQHLNAQKAAIEKKISAVHMQNPSLMDLQTLQQQETWQILADIVEAEQLIAEIEKYDQTP